MPLTAQQTIRNTFSNEINESIKLIVKYVQCRAFPIDLKCLKQNSVVDPSSKIRSLNPFVEENVIIMVAGRLKNAIMKSHNDKNPAIMPSNYHVTKLIVKSEHERLLHAGQQTTLYSIRQKYWIISGRNTVRKIIHNCVRCFKANPLPVILKMGDLPQDRLVPARAFIKSGVDYVGPVLLKEGGVRSKRRVKAYIAVFVCFTTKAIHIELVSNLSSESFISAFNRFISRRGHVTDIYCDNDTNFVGAKNKLQKNLKLFSSDIQDNLRSRNIKWRFIPARSPNFGGLWERSIRSIQQQLKRVIGNAHLTHEELYTPPCTFSKNRSLS